MESPQDDLNLSTEVRKYTLRDFFEENKDNFVFIHPVKNQFYSVSKTLFIQKFDFKKGLKVFDNKAVLPFRRIFYTFSYDYKFIILTFTKDIPDQNGETIVINSESLKIVYKVSGIFGNLVGDNEFIFIRDRKFIFLDISDKSHTFDKSFEIDMPSFIKTDNFYSFIQGTYLFANIDGNTLNFYRIEKNNISFVFCAETGKNKVLEHVIICHDNKKIQVFYYEVAPPIPGEYRSTVKPVYNSLKTQIFNINPLSKDPIIPGNLIQNTIGFLLVPERDLIVSEKYMILQPDGTLQNYSYPVIDYNYNIVAEVGEEVTSLYVNKNLVCYNEETVFFFS